MHYKGKWRCPIRSVNWSVSGSAIRLVTYAGGAPLICGVEEQETRPNEFTHIFAHPDLARLPIIGPGMGGDPELIMAAGPDVIFMTSTTAGEADALQKQNSRIYH